MWNTPAGNVPGITAKWHTYYNLHLLILSACQPDPRLNTSLFYYLGKRITKDDFQQCLVFTEPSVQRHLPQDSLEHSSRTSGIPCRVAIRLARRLLAIPVVVQPSNKKFSVPLMCRCCCSCSLLLCTIARNYSICTTLHSYVIPVCFCTPYQPCKFVGMVANYPVCITG
ncbi:hypothetical protein TNCV_3803391 [Trichonephila clavipes]|nr:hypothetical protein TNCV_3803391 [Trichonephila clavipes]